MQESISKSTWLAKVEKDLKGKPLSSLEWSLDGKTYTPFFHADDQAKEGLTSGRMSNDWHIGTTVYCNDLTAANEVARTQLNAGSNSLHFVLESELTKEDFDVLLKGIHLEWINAHFSKSVDQVDTSTADALCEYIKSSDQDMSKIMCTVDTGKTIPSLPNAKNTLLKPAAESETIMQQIASILQQTNVKLGKAAAEGNEKSFASKTVVQIPMTDDYFANIATIRATRLTLAQLLDAYDSVGEVYLSAIITDQTFVDDVNTNKIKSTSQAMAAAVAGADEIVVAPSDAKENKQGDDFSQRIAINIQHLLKMESYLDNVVDPSAGSYYIEQITNDLAEGAWDIFRK